MIDLVEKMLSGNRYALAKLISAIENRSTNILKIMDRVYENVKGIQTIGITGPPGAGKSTLVDQLIKTYRRQNKKVAVIAVDPSSPFSGGAILGDRIRMQAHATDSDVFIRSLASRGHYGGLTLSTSEVVKLFDVAGFDVVIIETVGVGQTEFSVMKVADTVVVVLVPESGDTIQTMKAGLLEVANIFVVNKSDRDGSDKIELELKQMIHLKPQTSQWDQPVLKTVAVKNEGIDVLHDNIEKHFLLKSNLPVDDHKLFTEKFIEIVSEELLARINTQVKNPSKEFSSFLASLENDKKNPYLIASNLFEQPSAFSNFLLKILL